MAGDLRKPRNWPLIAAFGVALCATLFFAVRMAVSAIYWSDPDHRDQPLAAWMTPRYIAHSHRVPPDLVASVLGIDAENPPRRTTLKEIAAERGVPVRELIEALEAAIAVHGARP